MEVRERGELHYGIFKIMKQKHLISWTILNRSMLRFPMTERFSLDFSIMGGSKPFEREVALWGFGGKGEGASPENFQNYDAKTPHFLDDSHIMGGSKRFEREVA